MDQNQKPDIKPSDKESSSSPPLMVKKTWALVEKMECDAKKIAELEDKLAKKQDYLLKLERFEANLQRNNAKLRPRLGFLVHQNNYIASQDSSIKNQCKNVDKTVRTLYGEANIVKHRLHNIYTKANDIGKSQQEDLERYEKRLRYLQGLEAQIKERRKRKLERIEAEEQSLEAENVELKAQLKIFTELEFDATDNVDDSYMEDVQEEIKALRVKLENLEMDNKVFSEKMMEYDAQEMELQNEFSDVAYSELEKKFDEVNAEALKLIEDLRNKTAAQQEVLTTLQNLEAYEKKVDAELEKTQKFMDEMQQNRQDELSKMDEQIEATLKCCEDKRVKYAFVCEEIHKNSQVLQDKEKLLEESVAVIKNLQIELENLQNSAQHSHEETLNLSKQSEEKRLKVDAFLVEKTVVETQIVADERQLDDLTKKLKLLKTRFESDMNNLTSTHLNLEKEKKTELEEATVKLSELETRKKSVEMELTSLEQTKATLQKEFEGIEMKTSSLSANIEKEEEKQRSSAPRPVFISKPPAFEAPPRKEANRKRNWNSDSSVEEIPLSKWNRNYKKQNVKPNKENSK